MNDIQLLRDSFVSGFEDSYRVKSNKVNPNFVPSVKRNIYFIKDSTKLSEKSAHAMQSRYLKVNSYSFQNDRYPITAATSRQKATCKRNRTGRQIFQHLHYEPLGNVIPR